MTSAAAAVSAFSPDADSTVDAAATWSYRRQARRLRDRFRHDAAALHASLKSLAAETDAAAPPRPPARAAVRSRNVTSRVVMPVGEPVAGTAAGSPDFDRLNSADRWASAGPTAGRAASVRPVGPSWPSDAGPADAASRAGQPAAASVGPTVRDVLNASPDAVDAFAALVRSAVSDGPIGFGRRQALVRRGDALRIGRFEAALIIAAVEHRHRTYDPSAATLPPVRRRTVAAAVAVALLLEGVVLAAFWVW